MLTALCLTAVVLAAPDAGPVAPDAGVAPAPTKTQLSVSQQPAVMAEALDAALTIAPWLPSPGAFRDPANQKAIGSSLEVLSRLRHPFMRGPGASSTGVAELFTQQATTARLDFASGGTEAARRRAQGLTQLCIACHVREPRRDFLDPEKRVEGLHLPPLQQAHFYAVTRQFDRALEVWKAELAKPRPETDVFEELESLRLAIRVAVRARDDAKLVQQLLAPQVKRTELPGFTRRELKLWQVDAAAWEKESFALATQKPEALVARAKQLAEASGALTNITPASEHFIKLLRAASYLDEAMRQEPQAASRGDALYLLGVVHGAVADLSLWQLEWAYFENCVRENPATTLAVTCAERLKDRTWFNWRSGSDMPAATQVALNELMAIARGAAKAPEKKTK